MCQTLLLALSHSPTESYKVNIVFICIYEKNHGAGSLKFFTRQPICVLWNPRTSYLSILELSFLFLFILRAHNQIKLELEYFTYPQYVCELIPNIFIVSVGIGSLTNIRYNIRTKYQISLQAKEMTTLRVVLMSIQRGSSLDHLIL